MKNDYNILEMELNALWKEIEINNNTYSISINKILDGYMVVLTNLVRVWVETLTDDIIQDKCKKLNPMIIISKFKYSDVLENLLNNLQKYAVEMDVTQIKLRMQLKANIIFKFELNLTEGTPLQLFNYVTKPLCIVSSALMHRHQTLLNLIKSKDEEIAEYKAEGAELIRKNIETKPFNETFLDKELILPPVDNFINSFQTAMDIYNLTQVSHTKLETVSQSSFNTSHDQIETEDDTMQQNEELLLPNNVINVITDKETSKPVKRIIKNKHSACTIIIPKTKKKSKIFN